MNDFTLAELEAMIDVFGHANVHPDDDNLQGDLYSRLLEARDVRKQMDDFASDCGDACKL